MSINDNWLTVLCRDCDHLSAKCEESPHRCPHCGSPRLIAHAELATLTLAHLDCDAFYAAVEKRDNPTIAHKPLIVGGGRRGVVTSACYIARLSGVKSAMPMFKALEACPDAVVIHPDMTKYTTTGRAIRTILEAATPLVEPLSIDEAFLDLAGTERLHGACPAVVCARLVRRIEAETGISVSIGLSHNKLLAKMASDIDKPRGFAVIGQAETLDFLEKRPVSDLWGVGKSLARKLQADGVRTIGDLRHRDPARLAARYGSIGHRLAAFAYGRDDRRVSPRRPAKSISAEQTFERDIADIDSLLSRLWSLCEKVSGRLLKADLSGQTVVVKLKTGSFRTLTRNRRLRSPTKLAGRLFDTASQMVREMTDGTGFRLIGVGLADLGPGEAADPPDLADPGLAKRKSVESAMFAIREKLGPGAIGTGRSLPK